MTVTMAMLYDGICKRYECVKGAKYQAGYPVFGVFVAREEAACCSINNACYISDCGSEYGMPGIPSEALIVCPKEACEGASCALMVLGVSDLETLSVTVARVIDSYLLWEDRLLNLDAHGADLDEMVDCAHTLLSNPITIIDENYRILAYTKNDGMNDALWVNVEGDGVLSDDSSVWAKSIDESGFVRYIETLKERGELRNYAAETGILLSACIARSSADRFVAVNVIEKNRAVSEGDFDCLKFFVQVVASKMQAVEHAWQNASSSYNELLYDIVDGKLSSSSDLKSRLAKLGFNVLPRFSVLVTAARDGLLKYHQFCQISDDFVRLLPEGKSIIHSRTLITFVNYGGEIDQERWMAVEQYLEERSFMAGLSDVQSMDSSLNCLVQQAKIALRIGKHCCFENAIVNYEECRPYYLFDLCRERSDWRRFLHPCLEQLAAYDAEANAPLMPTLECLIAHWGNKTVTAKALSIQRNTLQYRVGKIEQLCSMDLSDATTFDHIMSSIALRDYCMS